MRRLSVCLFVVAVCFFLGAALDVAYNQLFVLGFWRPQITCAEPVQDIGHISCDNVIRCRFLIRNAGNSELVVHDVKPSCGACLEIVDFPRSPIPPGAGGAINADLLASQLRGEVNKTLLVASNDPARPSFLLRVKGHVAAPRVTGAIRGQPRARGSRDNAPEKR